jgi:hypothetical protein
MKAVTKNLLYSKEENEVTRKQKEQKNQKRVENQENIENQENTNR